MYLREHRRRRRLRGLSGVNEGGPAWYRARQGSLGDDAITEPTISDAQFTREWQGKMMTAQDRLVDIGARWVKREELQRWLQIAATLSIPLAAAIWRAIFRASRRASTS